jgi:hypothetical protein
VDKEIPWVNGKLPRENQTKCRGTMENSIELHLKIKGNMKYLYALMDDEQDFG